MRHVVPLKFLIFFEQTSVYDAIAPFHREMFYWTKKGECCSKCNDALQLMPFDQKFNRSVLWWNRGAARLLPYLVWCTVFEYLNIHNCPEKLSEEQPKRASPLSHPFVEWTYTFLERSWNELVVVGLRIFTNSGAPSGENVSFAIWAQPNWPEIWWNEWLARIQHAI